MIKARSERTIVIGLTRGQLTRLWDGEALTVALDDLGADLPFNLTVLSADTDELSDADDLLASIERSEALERLGLEQKYGPEIRLLHHPGDRRARANAGKVTTASQGSCNFF